MMLRATGRREEALQLKLLLSKRRSTSPLETDESWKLLLEARWGRRSNGLRATENAVLHETIGGVTRGGGELGAALRDDLEVVDNAVDIGEA